MSTELMPFTYEGATVRTVVIDGEPWFVLADLCKVLDLANPSMVAERIELDALSTAEVIDSMGRTQQARIVNESGMYEVIFLSRKPEARAFRRWVTTELLPTVRKTGGYGAQPALSGPELLAHAVLEAQQMIAAKDQQIAELTDKVAEDAPKVNYVELYVAESDLLKLRVVASNNDVGENWLRDLLLDKGWIYVETESRWSERKQCKEIRRRYSAYSHKRSYFRPVEVHEAPRFRGEVMHTLKVTPAGAEAIARLVERERGAA